MSTSIPVKRSALADVTLIAEREVRMRLRSKAFLSSTLLLLVIVVAGIVAPVLFGGGQEATRVAVVGQAAAAAVGEHEQLTAIEAADAAAAEALLRDEEAKVAAAVISDPAAELGYRIIGFESEPREVISLLSLAPEVNVLDPLLANYWLAYFAAIAFGVLFFTSALTFGTTIAQSVVEEKQTRIVEILLATVSARTLLAGKVIGNTLLAFGQIAIIAAGAGVAMALTGQGGLLTAFGPAILWFVLFFTVGFVLLAALFAALAALVSRAEDINSAVAPVTYLVMIPYVLVIVFFSNPAVLTAMSYVPFSAPVGMPMRLFLGQVEWWEPVLSLVILIGSTLLVLAIGARVYQGSLLRTGAKVKLTEALRG